MHTRGLVILLCIAFFVASVCTYIVTLNLRSTAIPDTVHGAYGVPTPDFLSGTMLFTGDIMLARGVERKLIEYGSAYPFVSLAHILQEPTITVGNFEATIPEVHIPTADFAMRFSVDSQYLQALRDAGFDVLSLANNHAYDYGASAYRHTHRECVTTGVTCIGHPYQVSSSSSMVVSIGDTQVGLLALHVLDPNFSTTSVVESIHDLRTKADFVVVYPHWGEEYQFEPSEKQRTYAHFFIDEGADMVIGHHPHVIEPLERYKGKIIAYSLGNFVFDQYFSPEVQKGYMVHLLFRAEEVTVKLIYHTSIRNRAQPELELPEEVVRLQSTVLPEAYFTAQERESGQITITI